MFEGLHDIIEAVLTKNEPTCDDDKLLLSVLAEIKHEAEKRLYDVRPYYTISFTRSQAFGLRILSNDYIYDKTTYVGNWLHNASIEIHKKYQQ